MENSAPAAGAAQRAGRPAVALPLVGLAAVGLVQPLLDLLGRNVAFLVAHDVGRVEVVAGALILAFVVPLGIAGGVALAGRLHRVAGDLVLAAVVTVLTAGAVLRTARVTGAALPGRAAVALALVAGALVAVLWLRLPGMRRALSVTAVAAPAAVLIFLFATPVRGLVLPATAQHLQSAGAGVAAPVVFVMFDELPLASLLADETSIDRRAFPSFAALSDDATFFANVSAAHTSTLDAVPAAVSGRYSTYQSLPTVQDHPSNLLALLADSHHVTADEPLTQLCPPAECGQRPTSYTSLAKDVALIGAHLLAPPDLAQRLPPLDEGWRDFGAHSDADIESRREAVFARERAQGRDSVGAMSAFIRRVGRGPQPGLYFHHTFLPHRPWLYLPDGRRHMGPSRTATTEGLWTEQAWPVLQGYQLHLAQAQLADRLLGQLLERLQDTGLYDEALVVVLADHGGNFEPGASFREISADSFGEIGMVPLLIKAPWQRTGAVVSTPGETVDVVPTVLDILGLTPPSGLDGRSLLRGGGRTARTVRDFLGRPLRFPSGVGERQLRDAVRRRQRLFGRSGVDLYALTPPGAPEILGRRVEASRLPSARGLRVTLSEAAALRRVDPAAEAVPAAIGGVIEGRVGGPPITLAIAVNGRIAALTQTETAHPGEFLALVDPDTLRAGVNEVAVFTVDRAGAMAAIEPR